MRGILFAIAAVALASGCSGQVERVAMQIGATQFEVELATTPAARERGLMFQDALGPNEGMLFVFATDAVQVFWMRNTSLPLSIAFIDARGVLVHRASLEPFSERPVSSLVPVRYALEVNRGALDRAAAVVGMRVTLPASVPAAGL